jgi:hypothetical protein
VFWWLQKDQELLIAAFLVFPSVEAVADASKEGMAELMVDVEI